MSKTAFPAIILKYSATPKLAALADKAAKQWNKALQMPRALLSTHVNVAHVIINFGRVDRSTQESRVAQHQLINGTHHITLASDVKWRVSWWQRFAGIGQEDALAALLHEFGHCLGLPHSANYNDVMHAQLGSTVISDDEAARYRRFLKLP